MRQRKNQTIEQSNFVGLSTISIIKPRRGVSTLDGRTKVATFLHLGAGRQSSWIAEAMVEGELGPATAAIFADTGNEPPWVYEQVAYLGPRLASIGVPLSIVKRDGHGLVEAVRQSVAHGRFASLPFYTRHPDGSTGKLKRQCTSEYKIEPSNDFVLEWMINHDYGKVATDKNGVLRRSVNTKVYTDHLFGISYEEFWRAGHRGPRWKHAVYPLIDRKMRVEDCLVWLAKRNLPIPMKSSCIVCPFHDDEYWNMLVSGYMSLFEEACAFDDWLRTPDGKKTKQLKGLESDVYLHDSCTPLRSIDFIARIRDKQAAPLLELCGDFCMT